MKRRRVDDVSDNLTQRIAFREICTAPAGAQLAKSRSFAENVAPSAVIPHIQPPPNICISRFTPCGKYLVTFDAAHNDAVLYRYMGPPSRSFLGEEDYLNDSNFKTTVQQPQQQQTTATTSQPSEQPPLQSPPSPPPDITFNTLFQLHARCAIATQPDEQIFSFCLVAHGHYLILATSSPEGPPDHDGWLSVAESTTFHLVRMEDGTVLDRFTIMNDCVELNGNQAASLYEDLLAIVALATQTIYLLRVLPSGRFVFLHTIGRDCRDDDRLVIAQMEEAETRYKAQQQKARFSAPHNNGTSKTAKGVETQNYPEMDNGIPNTYRHVPALGSRALSPQQQQPQHLLQQRSGGTANTPTPPPSPLNTTNAHGSTTTVAQRGIGGVQQVVAHAAMINPLVGGSHHPSGGLDGGVSNGLLPTDQQGEGHLIQGLRQRLLTHLYLEAQRDSANASNTTSTTSSIRPSSVDIRYGDSNPASTSVQQQQQQQQTVTATASQPPPQQQQQVPGHRALNAFYYFFDAYNELIMTRVHLIDRERLLIQWSSAEWAASGRPPGHPNLVYRMIYNRLTTHVEHLFKASNSAEFQQWCRSEPGLLHGGSAASEWDRFVSPTLGERRHKEPHVDDLPLGCQTRQATPYLDSHVYHYDERFLSPDTQPRQLPHRPIKFMCRSRPEKLRFKFEPEDIAPSEAMRVAAGGSGARSHEVLYLFHPVEPFVLVVVDDAETGLAESLTVYTRA